MDDPSREGPAIPILKEEEKERKGSGAILPGASEENARSGMFAILTGKAGLAALALGVGGAGLIAFGILKERSAPVEESAAGLDGPRASIPLRVRDSQGSRSLNFASEASKGQLNWEGGQPLSSSPAPTARTSASGTSEAEAKPEAPRRAAAPAAAPSAPPRLADTPDGARLTTRSAGSRFGRNDIFSGSRGFGAGKGFAPLEANPARAPSSSPAPAGNAPARPATSSAVSATRAMGQLKFSSMQSRMGALTDGAEGGASYGSQAFEQQTSQSAALPAPPPGISGTGNGPALGNVVQPPGSGAPSLDAAGGSAPACPGNWAPAPGGGGCVPPDAVGGNATPYQSLVDEARQLRDLSGNLLIAGTSLLALAAVLFATGVNAPAAAVIAGIGTALLVVSQSLSSMERQISKTVGTGYGQQGQGRIIDGTSPGGGMPAGQSPVSNAVQNESNAAFHP